MVGISNIDAGLLLDMAQGDTIGNRVFIAEATGLQPAADASLLGLTAMVQLLDASGVVLQSTPISRLGANRGYYGFAAAPGTYRLRFVSNTSNFIPTPFPNTGGDDTFDSDINDEGLTSLFTLAEGSVRRDLDAGFVPLVNVGNSVWRDSDADGVQDGGEPGVPNVVVELWDAAKSRRWTSTSTNSNGIFSLPAPGPGNYRLWVLRPHPGDSFSPLNVGGDDTKDSDVLSTALDYGFSEPFTLAPGVIATTNRDAGLIFAAGARVLTPLRITAFRRSPPELSFSGPAGGTYRIERSNGLSTWTSVSDPFVTLSANTTIALAPGDMIGPEKFWRVRRTR